MDDFAHISALEARDRKRYPVELANMPQRGGPRAPGRARVETFSEVAKNSAEASLPVKGPVQTVAVKPKPFMLWEQEAFGFRDFVDVLNPLQHIPIVATVYRKYTDDKIGFAPRIFGGALWGRIGGLVGGVINAVVDIVTGKDIGDHVYAALFEKSSGAPSDSTIAQSGAAAAEARTAKPAEPASSHLPIDPGTPKAQSEPLGVSHAAGTSACLPPASAGAPAQARLNGYLPENRWDIHDGDDRRVRFTA